MKKLAAVATLVVGALVLIGAASGPGFGGKGVRVSPEAASLIPNEIIVAYTADTKAERRAHIRNRFGMKLKRASRKAGRFEVQRHGNPAAVLERLRSEPGVLYAEQNARAFAQMTPNDPYFNPYQWHMMRIGMQSAWDGSTGAGVVVAVIDTGIKQSLADLAQTQFTTGYDFVNNDSDPTDDEGHGSHVAGTIAQSTNNGVGVAGVAFDATLMPLKVLDASGSGDYTDIADAIYYAADHGAQVINLSLGGYSNLTTLRTAVEYAWDHGVVVVCAAGNDHVRRALYPAAYPDAISVTATGGNDAAASYSNYGSTVDIAAPGGDYGDYNGDGYDDFILQNTFSGSSQGYYFYAGTSMASPHVAGVAALVKAANPRLTNSEIRSIIESTATDLGSSGWDRYFGNGLVNAAAAVEAASGGPVCVPTESEEATCDDGVDNDCDGMIDDLDPDCYEEPECLERGESCTSNDQCCSGRCRIRRGVGRCR